MPVKKQKQNNKGKTNPLLQIFFAVIIPACVIIALVIVILSFSGVDVAGWAKNAGSHIPVVSSVVSSGEDEKEAGNTIRDETLITRKDEEINKLKEEIKDLEIHIDHLEQDMVKLENRNKSEKRAGESSESKKTETENNIKKASASFRKMDPGQAASIISRLEKENAVRILMELSNDVRGDILEAMEPEQAAGLTELLLKDTD
jgi:flagellar motility protein MotE (MotC chaperone)